MIVRFVLATFIVSILVHQAEAKGGHTPLKWNLQKINAYLPKLGSLYWPFDQWAKPLCVTDIETI